MELKKTEINTEGTIYKPSSPFVAKLLENRRISHEESQDDIRHIVLDITGSGIQYIEGQSIGIIPPYKPDEQRPRVRLYSISSPRTGELGQNTLSLTIKRVIVQDPETGEEIRGLASNFICNSKPGDPIEITGPIGRSFILPKDDTVNLIMIAVGTGIAPFRAFIRYIYHERKSWRGNILLFYGSKTGMESLYMNDRNNDIGQYYDQETFTAFHALSHEGEKKFVQDKLAINNEKVWNIIKEGNFSFYLCGLKGVEEGVKEILRELAKNEGKNWDDMQAEFKKEGRWHIEVY